MTSPAPAHARPDAPTPKANYDAIVIGGGSGGLTAAIGLTNMHRSVAVIEAGPIGGDCTNTGCIPSKTLINLTKAGNPNPFADVRAKRNHLRDEEAVEVAEKEHLDLLWGRGFVEGPGRVRLTTDDGEEHVLTTDHVVIATGSMPRPLDIEGLPSDRRLTNENLWDLDAPPEHLAVVGAGPISLEMASAFRRLGTRVSVVEMAPQVLVNEDADAAAIVRDSLGEAGVEFHLGTVATHYDEATSSLHLETGEVLADVDKVLVAIGRIPRFEELGLDAAGVETTRRGITIDSWGRTSVKGVWAVGDCTGRTLTTHGANAIGRRVVQGIVFPLVPKVTAEPWIPNATFTTPEIASVGVPVRDLDRLHPPASRIRLRADLADTDRGYTDGVENGAVIVDAERLTGKILRATIVGPAAGDAIGLFTLAMQEDISLHKIFRMSHPYPTYAWAIATIADDFTAQTLPDLPNQALAYLRAIPHKLRNR